MLVSEGRSGGVADSCSLLISARDYGDNNATGANSELSTTNFPGGGNVNCGVWEVCPRDSDPLWVGLFVDYTAGQRSSHTTSRTCSQWIISSFNSGRLARSRPVDSLPCYVLYCLGETSAHLKTQRMDKERHRWAEPNVMCAVIWRWCVWIELWIAVLFFSIFELSVGDLLWVMFAYWICNLFT